HGGGAGRPAGGAVDDGSDGAVGDVVLAAVGPGVAGAARRAGRECGGAGGGDRRLPAVRESAAIDGVLGTGAERTLQRRRPATGPDHADGQWSRAADSGGGVVELSVPA